MSSSELVTCLPRYLIETISVFADWEPAKSFARHIDASTRNVSTNPSAASVLTPKDPL